MSSTHDQRTVSHDCATVTLYDSALCEVRYTEDNVDGVTVTAVELDGVWLDPVDVLLPTIINCMAAEIEAMLRGDRAEQRYQASHMGAL